MLQSFAQNKQLYIGLGIGATSTILAGLALNHCKSLSMAAANTRLDVAQQLQAGEGGQSSSSALGFPPPRAPPPGLEDVSRRHRVYPMKTSGAGSLDGEGENFVTVQEYHYSLDQGDRKFKPVQNNEYWAIVMGLDDADVQQQIKAFSGGGSAWTKNLEKECKCSVMLRGRGADGKKGDDGLFVVDDAITSPPIVLVGAKPGEKLNQALDLVERRLEEVRDGHFDEIENRLGEVHARRSEYLRDKNQEGVDEMKMKIKELQNEYQTYLKQKWKQG